MRRLLGSLLGHHVSCRGLLEIPITTIVIAVGRILVDHNELLATPFRLLDVVFAQFLEEVHDTGHSLGVGLRAFSGGDDLLDRLAIEHESSLSDEPLVGLKHGVCCTSVNRPPGFQTNPLWG